MAESKAGYLYVLSNSSMPGQIKVGRTERSPQDRVKELSTATGVPTPFVLRHQQFFRDCHLAEKTVHERWEAEGLRVAGNREFFRMEVATAIAVIDQLARVEAAADGPPDKAVIKELLDEGFRWLRGDTDRLRNELRAMEHFEQASALGSLAGPYWAGRASEAWANVQTRKNEQMTWRQRALQHYQTALDRGHVKACARASWLLRDSGQLEHANALWMEFLHRLARAPADEEAFRWVWMWAQRQVVVDRRALPDSTLWASHGSALLRTDVSNLTIDSATKTALQRKIWSLWRRGLHHWGPEAWLLILAWLAGHAVAYASWFNLDDVADFLSSLPMLTTAFALAALAVMVGVWRHRPAPRPRAPTTSPSSRRRTRR